MLLLENEFALVTGASKGIGKATAIMLSKFGANVFVHYNNSLEGAKNTAERIIDNGRKAYIVKADITKHQEIKDMYGYIRSKTSKLDILVNNVGINKMNYINYMKEEEWDDVIDTNLKGAFLCSKYASKLMMPCNKGNIINISSDAAITPGVRQVNYVASKAGLIAMTRSMAKELGSFGIRVNAVAPGPIKTDSNNMNKSEIERVEKMIPLHRIGEPDDVAKVIVFLCSEMANYITGQVIQVDGGLAP